MEPTIAFTHPVFSSSAPSSFGIPTAAYLHIPFCRRRCFYCDFPISVVGDRPPLARSQGDAANFGTIADYVEILCREIAATPVLGKSLETVFFGGGTPSLLNEAQLNQILTALDRHFGIAATAEISMEIDPGTFDLARLQGYKAAGVNRVSLGVQSFQLEILQACGRTHTPADIQVAIDLLHQVEMPNFSLDLISGLPHLTPALWQDSLVKAIALQPAHLSVYDLTVEAGTSFDRWYTPGTDPLPTEEATAEMYRMAQKMLTAAGFEHYEISNYARSGYQCRHNRVYWENRSYYGFGMAAASYVQGQRFTRPRKRQDYYHWVEALRQNQGRINCPVASPTDRLLDSLMLGLRLAEGMQLAMLIDQFGEAIVEQILACLQPYCKRGWVCLEQENLDLESHREERSKYRIRLSDPEGFLFSNVVLTELFQAFSE